jgi:hypothetical protein
MEGEDRKTFSILDFGLGISKQFWIGDWRFWIGDFGLEN